MRPLYRLMVVLLTVLALAAQGMAAHASHGQDHGGDSAPAHEVHASTKNCHGDACDAPREVRIDASCAVVLGHCLNAVLRGHGFARAPRLATPADLSLRDGASPSGLTLEAETPPPRS